MVFSAHYPKAVHSLNLYSARLREFLSGLGKLLSGPAAKFVEGVPLESKGIRKVIDYGFTPVSQVAKDIKSGVGRLMPRKNALQEGVSYLPPGAQAA